MHSRSFQSVWVMAALPCFWAVMTALGESRPCVPRDDQQVLERLRSTAFDPAARELRAWRTRLAAEPDNLDLAAQLARRYLERSRAEWDPRSLGHAQSALAHWWIEPQPPTEALVLRATVKQSQHDFAAALADLDLALKTAPGHIQARLTRATILTVLGRYEEARHACLPLARLAPGLVAVTAAASVASLNGEAERSCRLLSQTLAAQPGVSTSEKLWALTVLAEASARLGRASEAERAFQSALALGQRDAYLLGTYADFLLDQQRASEAAALLKDETRADGLLLRLALAEAALVPPPATLATHTATLSERFEASRLRGDRIHQREEARFTLHLLRQPQESLRLAQANWLVQREPADARILLEAALAAHSPAAARPVLDFVAANRLEDVQLTRLADALSRSAGQ